VIKMATQAKVIEGQNAHSVSEIKYTRDATGYDTIKRMSTEGRIATNLFVDPLYQSVELKQVLWVDPVIVYTRPGQAFGQHIEFDDVIFIVPKDYWGVKDAAFALPSKSFKAAKSDSKLVISIKNGANITLVKDFPVREGWYLTDPQTGIPYGQESGNKEARHLSRSKEPYIGPVVRGFNAGNGNGRCIDVGVGLFNRYEVAVLEFEQRAKPAQLTVSDTKLSRKVADLLRHVGPAEESLQKLNGVVNDAQLKALRKLVREARGLEIKS
jgi:hypothetical protein